MSLGKSGKMQQRGHEGVALVHRFAGEFPQRYLQEVLDYLEVDL